MLKVENIERLNERENIKRVKNILRFNELVEDLRRALSYRVQYEQCNKRNDENRA